MRPLDPLLVGGGRPTKITMLTGPVIPLFLIWDLGCSPRLDHQFPFDLSSKLQTLSSKLYKWKVFVVAYLRINKVILLNNITFLRLCN